MRRGVVGMRGSRYFGDESLGLPGQPLGLPGRDSDTWAGSRAIIAGSLARAGSREFRLGCPAASGVATEAPA